MIEAADLAREVAAILGREVKGVRTKSGGGILSVPGHSLQISPGVPVDVAGCARVLGGERQEAISAALTKAYDNIIKEAPEHLTRLLDQLSEDSVCSQPNNLNPSTNATGATPSAPPTSSASPPAP